jgi:hypothetical protein
MCPPSSGPEGLYYSKPGEVSVRPAKSVVGGIRDPTWRVHGRSQQVAGYLAFSTAQKHYWAPILHGTRRTTRWILIRCRCRQRPVTASAQLTKPIYLTADHEISRRSRRSKRPCWPLPSWHTLIHQGKRPYRWMRSGRTGWDTLSSKSTTTSGD